MDLQPFENERIEEMKRFYIICIGICAVLAGITTFFQKESTKFYGIADTKETIINSESGVEIRKLFVVQGQTVNAGDTLVILDQPELVIRINEILHTLNEYKAQKTYQTTFSRSEKRKYQAEQEERINEINAQIRELESQYEMNKKLVKELRSLKKEGADEADSSNPILTQIQSLRRLLESARNPAQVQIDRLTNELSTTNDPIESQVRRYTNELDLLQKEQQKLIMCAQINGMIGMVKFKEGEKVSPFDTILTLHAAAPSYVKGYIHEAVYSRVTAGDTVVVQSVTDEKQNVLGIVVGVGSRIVDYPVRLQRRADIPIWGREVLIKIPEDNSFLLGEKVLITDVRKKKTAELKLSSLIIDKMVPSASAAPLQYRNTATSSTINNITIAHDLTVSPLEASGLIYLPDIKSYLLISDDTDKKQPMLFLMDENGHVGHSVLIDGLQKINDMEGIACDDRGFIYLLTSQSFNQKGVQPPARKLLARVRRSGSSFMIDKSVFLFDLLLAAASEKKSAEWASFVNIGAKEKSIDIEGIAWRHDTLLLGCKNPKMRNKAVILGIADPDALFGQQRLSPERITVWHSMTIYDSITGTFCGISDLAFHNDTLFGVSTGVASQSGVDADVGMFWNYSPDKRTMRVIRSFPGLKPEGLTFNGDRNEFCLVFDNGANNPSQMMTVKVSL